jgi:hypothetical protein
MTVCFFIFWNYSAIVFLYAPRWIYDTRVSDFHTFYMAGKSWLSGLNPYVNLQAHISFLYPPTSLPFFGMFAPFEFNLAAQLWTVTYVFMFAVALLSLAFTLKSERRFVYVSIAVLFLLSSFPFQRNIELSQGIDLIIASLTILSLVMERIKHQFASAVLLSIATLMKGPAIFLLIYFVIFRRDLRYLANFLVSTLAIVGAFLLVVPFKLYWEYAVNVLPTLYSEYSLEHSQSIVRLFYLTGLGKPALQAISVVGFGLFALFAFYVNSNKWANSFGKATFRADCMFLMNGLTILFLSPRSLIYPYVWAIIPVALFLSALFIEDVRLAYLGLIGMAAFLMNSNPFPLLFYYLGLSVTSTPWAAMGSLILTVSLIPIFTHPIAISHRFKPRLSHGGRT